jgi:hypothetical protein
MFFLEAGLIFVDAVFKLWEKKACRTLRGSVSAEQETFFQRRKKA